MITMAILINILENAMREWKPSVPPFPRCGGLDLTGKNLDTHRCETEFAYHTIV